MPAAMETSDNRTIFALLSPCGHGNLGDAATMTAAIQNISRRVSSARFVGLTLKPSDTMKRHAIPSYPIAAISRPMYVVVPQENDCQEPMEQVVNQEQTDVGRWRPVRNVLKRIAHSLLPSSWIWNARSEARHLIDAYRLMKDVRMLVVPGGGQLDDYWGGPWGHPYALMKWALIAKLAGARFVILSTGFGSLESRLSRLFARIALGLSDYCSYRDAGSKARMQRVGFHRNDPVLPDLAFSIEVSDFTDTRQRSRQSTRVCISPMVYCHPHAWPTKNERAYQKYLSNLTEVAKHFLEQGHDLVLLASDGADNLTVSDLQQALLGRLPQELATHIHVPHANTVEAFVYEVSHCEFLIASRLHGVILSHLASTPAIAMSYDRKVSDLMTAMQQDNYCLNIDTFTPTQVIGTANSLLQNIQDAQTIIHQKHREFRTLLDAQYDHILPDSTHDRK